MRTRKEFDEPRRTHKLETAVGETCREMEKYQLSESHSHPGDGRRKDSSGRGKKSTELGALTSWRRQRDGLVKMRKETGRVRCTNQLETAKDGLVRTGKETDRGRRAHSLETAEEETCQEMKRYRASEAHSLPEDGKGRDLSGREKNQTERGALTS